MTRSCRCETRRSPRTARNALRRSEQHGVDANRHRPWLGLVYSASFGGFLRESWIFVHDFHCNSISLHLERTRVVRTCFEGCAPSKCLGRRGPAGQVAGPARELLCAGAGPPRSPTDEGEDTAEGEEEAPREGHVPPTGKHCSERGAPLQRFRKCSRNVGTLLRTRYCTSSKMCSLHRRPLSSVTFGHEKAVRDLKNATAGCS